MVVHNFNISCFIRNPFETNTPLVIDTNAILTCAVTFQLFQPITGNGLNILQVFCFVQIE
mgnify:CR=1 FL=1